MGLIEAGISRLFGVEKHIVVLDNESNLICLLYNTKTCRDLIQKYLYDHDIDQSSLKFESINLNRKDEKYSRLMQFKIVILDKELFLYKELAKKAETLNIEGYDGKLPRYGINEFKTI